MYCQAYTFARMGIFPVACSDSVYQFEMRNFFIGLENILAFLLLSYPLVFRTQASL